MKLLAPSRPRGASPFSRSRRGAGRRPSRMAELQAILEAGYKDKDEVARMMRVSKRVLNVYLRRLGRYVAPPSLEAPSTIPEGDRIHLPDGEIVRRDTGEVLGYGEEPPYPRKSDRISFTNHALWGRGLGSSRPGAGSKREKQRTNKALLEESFALLAIKRALCDILDTPSTPFGHLITDRAAILAERELRERMVERLIDAHECELIIRHVLRRLREETPIVRRYIDRGRLKIVMEGLKEA